MIPFTETPSSSVPQNIEPSKPSNLTKHLPVPQVQPLHHTRNPHPSHSSVEHHVNHASSPQAVVKKSRGGTRVPIFEGECYQVPVDKLLDLDPSGIPVLATPILQYGMKRGWSTEALLKQASIGQFNTAVRYWFKGQNLTRQSVLEGAAVIVEWFEALQQGRARRNTTVDMSRVPELVKKITNSKSRRSNSSTNKRKNIPVHAHAKKRAKAEAFGVRNSSIESQEILRQSQISLPALHPQPDNIIKYNRRIDSEPEEEEVINFQFDGTDFLSDELTHEDDSL